MSTDPEPEDEITAVDAGIRHFVAEHERASGRGPASERPRELRVGELVAGKFVVERVIGRGGMGQVVAARHIELGTLVAIKTLLPSADGSMNAKARFAREALAMARLTSEHAVRVHDVGETELGLPFFVMDLLDGNDLWTELQRRGPLPIAEASAWILQACDALSEAHGLGIVHRDLKPGNLFLARRKSGERVVRVLDFGVAKAVDEIGVPLGDANLATNTGTLGTPNFMAPEQIGNVQVGPRTDVYGIGATLYTLLTGAYPFDGENPMVVLHRVRTTPPRRPREIRPDIPAAVESVLLTCLAKSPDQRFPSIADFAAALRRATATAPAPRDARRVTYDQTVKMPATDSGRAISLPPTPPPIQPGPPFGVVTPAAAMTPTWHAPPAYPVTVRKTSPGLVALVVFGLIVGASLTVSGVVYMFSNRHVYPVAAHNAPVTATARMLAMRARLATIDRDSGGTPHRNSGSTVPPVAPRPARP